MHPVLRCLESISRLLLRLFSAGRQPQPPAPPAGGGPGDQPEQQQQLWRWRQLQAACYKLLNALVEGSCIDGGGGHQERQLLVLPLDLTGLLQELVEAEVCITGGV
jgi:hypothetical protein